MVRAKCFHCGKWFEKEEGDMYEACPHCGKGFDDLTPEAKRAVKATIASVKGFMTRES